MILGLKQVWDHPEELETRSIQASRKYLRRTISAKRPKNATTAKMVIEGSSVKLNKIMEGLMGPLV
jgi:hypothetical protein